MAGLVPAIHEPACVPYISRKSSLDAWMGIHHDEPAQRHAVRRRHGRLGSTCLGTSAGLVEGFTKQYGLTRLVFAEHYDDMRVARQQKRNMKHWRRFWKVRLILSQNPNWVNLYDRPS